MEYVRAVSRASCALDLEREIVGIRFLFSEEEYKSSVAPIPTGRMSYCRMVTRASRGKQMKVDVNNFGCFAAARVLGLVEMDDWYTSGNYYGNCGLYRDFSTGKRITDQMSRCYHKIHGLEIQPLRDFSCSPHVVITISNPFNIMRLIQGYAYQYGNSDNFKFLGSQAMCAESTAHPYATNDINISLLCAGARKSGLKSDEISLGATLSKYLTIVDGLCATITPVENNQRKEHILKRFAETKENDVSIIMNTNYGQAMHKYDFAHFVKKK